MRSKFCIFFVYKNLCNIPRLYSKSPDLCLHPCCVKNTSLIRILGFAIAFDSSRCQSICNTVTIGWIRNRCYLWLEELFQHGGPPMQKSWTISTWWINVANSRLQVQKPSQAASRPAPPKGELYRCFPSAAKSSPFGRAGKAVRLWLRGFMLPWQIPIYQIKISVNFSLDAARF